MTEQHGDHSAEFPGRAGKEFPRPPACSSSASFRHKPAIHRRPRRLRRCTISSTAGESLAGAVTISGTGSAAGAGSLAWVAAFAVIRRGILLRDLLRFSSAPSRRLSRPPPPLAHVMDYSGLLGNLI